MVPWPAFAGWRPPCCPDLRPESPPDFLVERHAPTQLGDELQHHPGAIQAINGAVNDRRQVFAHQGVLWRETGQADFLVYYHLSIERRLDTVTINAPYRQGGSEWEVHRVQREEVTVAFAIGLPGE